MDSLSIAHSANVSFSAAHLSDIVGCLLLARHAVYAAISGVNMQLVQGLEVLELKDEDDLDDDEIAALRARRETPSEADVAKAFRHVIITMPRERAMRRVDVMVNGEPGDMEFGMDERAFDFSEWTPLECFDEFRAAWHSLLGWPDKFDYLFGLTNALNPPYFSWLSMLEVDWADEGGRQFLLGLAKMWKEVLAQVCAIPLPWTSPRAPLQQADLTTIMGSHLLFWSGHLMAACTSLY